MPCTLRPVNPIRSGSTFPEEDMTAELSILNLMAQASIPVQVIMAILILASVVSWAVIFSKRQLLSA